MDDAGTITLCGSLSRHAVSLGAAMHEAGYRALGLNFRYVPFEVSDLQGALHGMRALGIRGFGVSMPFKIEVMPLLDRVDALAQHIGAVNTIVNHGGTLVGYNTDAWGAQRALEEVIELLGRRVLLVGAGGAARAVAHGLVEAGAELHIVNRSVERAQTLAAQVARDEHAAVSAGGLDTLQALDGFHVVVNATSVGMREYGEASLIDRAALRPDLVVMDIVYKPIQTRLLQLAAEAGAIPVHGGRMLLHQASRQFELYTGRPAPLDAMDAALRAQLGD